MGDIGRGEGRPRPKKWEIDEEDTRWCPECRTYTEHDMLGCVDCGIREQDREVHLEPPKKAVEPVPQPRPEKATPRHG